MEEVKIVVDIACSSSGDMSYFVKKLKERGARVGGIESLYFEAVPKKVGKVELGDQTYNLYKLSSGYRMIFNDIESESMTLDLLKEFRWDFISYRTQTATFKK